jgi:hypothetical protein
MFNILYTGQIYENSSLFKSNLSSLIENFGHLVKKIVIVSGDKFERSYVEDVDREIIFVNNQKKIRQIGFRNSFYFQNSDLKVGLSQFEDSDLILKTRPDVFLEEGTVNYLSQFDFTKSVIWTTSISDQYLGLVSDHSYCGRKIDLMNLVSKAGDKHRDYFSGNGTYAHMKLWHRYLCEKIGEYDLYTKWFESIFRESKYSKLLYLTNKDLLVPEFKNEVWKARFEICSKYPEYTSLLLYLNFKIREILSVGVFNNNDYEAAYINRLGPNYISKKEIESSEKYGRRMLYSNETYSEIDRDHVKNYRLNIDSIFHNLGKILTEFDQRVEQIIYDGFRSKFELYKSLKLITRDEINLPYKVIKILRQNFGN